ncbi:hypothetical protein ACP4OV_028799 [Aristida adscensionis]
MAVPSSSPDRARRPFLLSLSLFLLLSALLLLLFTFLDPAPRALTFLLAPSRLAGSAPSLAPLPHHLSPAAVPPHGAGRPPPSRPATPLADAAAAGREVEGAGASSRPVTAATAEAGGSRPAENRGVATPVVADGKAVEGRGGGGDGGDEAPAAVRWEACRVGRGVAAADYIPCLDNVRAIKRLRSRRHMEHRERHCPVAPRPRCLVRLPAGYRTPVPWPLSRDMISSVYEAYFPIKEGWRFVLKNVGVPLLPNLPRSNHEDLIKQIEWKLILCFLYHAKEVHTCAPIDTYDLPAPCTEWTAIWYNNVPHPKLVEYKKDQNWVKRSGDYLVFPGGGTQFKDGVARYIQFIEQIMPAIQWGIHTRTVLDVGCGVASFGGHLLDRNVITMSFAPKDEHEAQIQFALERGIPAFLAVIGTQKLPFPDNVFDVVHCARCRVHWYANGGKPLMELNRVLRPGGYFIWSATPVYRQEKRDQDDWNASLAMVTVTNSICWRTVVKSQDVNGIGVVIYQKPTSNSCYMERKASVPPLCSERDGSRFPWYAPLDNCLLPSAVSSSDERNNWPVPWPERLNVRSASVPDDSASENEKFHADTTYWKQIVSEVYFNDLPLNWSSTRNVMDMNAGSGGFAAALIDKPLWVMNVVPVGMPDTLPVVYNRGLIGAYHDWCESFNTYPRTYDLLHMSNLIGSLIDRCDIIEVAAEIDRILRPGRWFVLKDTIEMIKRMRPVLKSLHYETVIVKQQFLVATKSFWRPG